MAVDPVFSVPMCRIHFTCLSLNTFLRERDALLVFVSHDNFRHQNHEGSRQTLRLRWCLFVSDMKLKLINISLVLFSVLFVGDHI